MGYSEELSEFLDVPNPEEVRFQTVQHGLVMQITIMGATYTLNRS